MVKKREVRKPTGRPPAKPDGDGREPSPLAKKLRKLMALHKVKGKPMSANQLAKQSGVTQTTITRILNGDTQDPRTELLERIARPLNVTANALRDDGHKVPDPRKAGMNLMYVSDEELDILTQFRQTNPQGQRQIDALSRTIAVQSPAAIAPLRIVGRR